MTEAPAVSGKLIGDYRVASEIASTSLSCTYRGERTTPSEGPVAIKVWHALALAPLQQRQFLQDVRLLTMLRHPHLLPIREGGLDGQCPYLVTDFAPAGSLRERLERQPGRPLPLAEGLSILSQVGQALQYAHHFHLTHGHLTPDNVLFTAQGQVLVSDFAVSTLVEAERAAQSESGRAASYRAPEQFQGRTTEASDQYALGCLGYELLTGRPPFPTADERPAAQERRPLPPTLLNMLLPAPLEEALLTALAWEQQARHASVKDLLTALDPASRWQPRELAVPVTPRYALPVSSCPRLLAQPASRTSPSPLGTRRSRSSTEGTELAAVLSRSDLAETPKPPEQAQTAILSPAREALLPQDRTAARASLSAEVAPTAPLRADAHPLAAALEARRPVSSGRGAGQGQGRRSSRVFRLAALLLSLVVMAGIIGFSRLATLSLFSPKAAVQVSQRAPGQTPPAAPAAAPSPSPTATPSPSSPPTRQPPPPTPSPAAAPMLLASPSQINAHTGCRVRGHWYSCLVTLDLPAGTGGGAAWSASSSGLAQVAFSPQAGVLSAGQAQQVSVSIRNSCPASGSLMFSSSSSTTAVTWTC